MIFKDSARNVTVVTGFVTAIWTWDKVPRHPMAATVMLAGASRSTNPPYSSNQCCADVAFSSGPVSQVLNQSLPRFVKGIDVVMRGPSAIFTLRVIEGGQIINLGFGAPGGSSAVRPMSSAVQPPARDMSSQFAHRLLSLSGLRGAHRPCLRRPLRRPPRRVHQGCPCYLGGQAWKYDVHFRGAHGCPARGGFQAVCGRGWILDGGHAGGRTSSLPLSQNHPQPASSTTPAPVGRLPRIRSA